jgi:serine O-acetyltransferase
MSTEDPPPSREAALGKCVCEGGTLRDAVRSDLDRYLYAGERTGEARLLAVLRVALSPKLWTVQCYRLSHYTATAAPLGPLRSVAKAFVMILQRLVNSFAGIEIDPRAHIGPGLLIPHKGYVIIGPVRIGANCTISQGVTLGEGALRSSGGTHAAPRLGDRVWVGPGAVIAGGIEIGSDAAVGANSLVTRDVPPRGVVLGVPARLVSREGSFDLVDYRHSEQDPARHSAKEPLPNAE